MKSPLCILVFMYTSKSLIVSVIFFLLSIVLQTNYLGLIERTRSISPQCPWCVENTSNEDIVFIPVDYRLIKSIFPADPGFLADLLWMRTSYYFGKQTLSKRDYRYLLHLLDLITNLDPKWEQPYVFGAVVMAIEVKEPDAGLYLIEKGLKHIPSSYSLWFYKGFYLWRYKKDLKGASEALFKAAQLRGSPSFLYGLAITLATRAGERALAIAFIEQALKDIKDPEQRAYIKKKMETLLQVD